MTNEKNFIYGVEVELQDKKYFNIVCETLSRMGISNNKEKKLYQSAHILHKKGKYYIVHFKEMFALDGRKTNIEDVDILRRNLIAKILEEWGLLKIKDSDIEIDNSLYISIIPYKEKSEWELLAKYSIGKRKK